MVVGLFKTIDGVTTYPTDVHFSINETMFDSFCLLAVKLIALFLDFGLATTESCFRSFVGAKYHYQKMETQTLNADPATTIRMSFKNAFLLRQL